MGKAKYRIIFKEGITDWFWFVEKKSFIWGWRDLDRFYTETEAKQFLDKFKIYKDKTMLFDANFQELK